VVEPVRPSRRGRPRADQARDHEIDPEYLLQDAREAGFRVVGLQDPFTSRDDDIEWLMALQPADMPSVTAPAPTPTNQLSSGEPGDSSIRISIEDFWRLASQGKVTIVDVRAEDSFAVGHIPGALSIPLASVENAVERLRRLGKPVVTYCS
jgi:hypothetical protein